MREGTIATLVVLTFLGMVGIYVGLWMAYRKYQQYAPAIDKASADLASVQSAGSGVAGLLSLLK